MIWSKPLFTSTRSIRVSWESDIPREGSWDGFLHRLGATFFTVTVRDILPTLVGLITWFTLLASSPQIQSLWLLVEISWKSVVGFNCITTLNGIDKSLSSLSQTLTLLQKLSERSVAIGCVVQLYDFIDTHCCTCLHVTKHSCHKADFLVTNYCIRYCKRHEERSRDGEGGRLGHAHAMCRRHCKSTELPRSDWIRDTSCDYPFTGWFTNKWQGNNISCSLYILWTIYF